MKQLKNITFDKELVQSFLKKTGSLWLRNVHWFFTLLFVVISIFAVYEWYRYGYDMESEKDKIKEELLQLEQDEFDTQKFNSALDKVQTRKTDFYRGIQVERDVFDGE
jgi:anionic cell wall polymer biosynthesis LytR-Cps2A-Psr (LCP) family protein